MTDQPKGTRPNEIFRKYNSHHDGKGRFASGGSGGVASTSSLGGAAAAGGSYAYALMDQSMMLASLLRNESNKDARHVERIGGLAGILSQRHREWKNSKEPHHQKLWEKHKDTTVGNIDATYALLSPSTQRRLTDRMKAAGH